ncbi:MAG: hypothetical protein WCN95_06780 [bacterium]
MRKTLVIAPCLALLLLIGCVSNQRSGKESLSEFDKSLKTTKLHEVDLRGMTFHAAVSGLFRKGNHKLYEQNSSLDGFDAIVRFPEGFNEPQRLDVYMRECSIYDCFNTLATSAGLAMGYRGGSFFIGSPEYVAVMEHPQAVIAQGNAPHLDSCVPNLDSEGDAFSLDSFLFYNDTNTVYYLKVSKDWSNSFGGHRTKQQ